MREAFATGELSYCKVRAITRVATPETEEQLVHLGLHASGSQLEKVVRLFRGAIEATTERAQHLHERRGLSYQWNDDGSLSLRACLPPEEGALVLAALKASEANVVPQQDDSAEAPTPNDPPAARRADALVSMARSVVDATPICHDGEPCEVSVHVDVNSLAGDQVTERCELADGPSITPETARRLSCDGSVVRIIERDGTPLSVGGRKRTISAPLRRALHSRDGGCRFPGCSHKRYLHAHHIHHWARGGPTTLENLIHLCSYHHRLVHEGGFCVERAGEHVRFRRPNGTLIPDAIACRRAHGPGLADQQLARGLSIDTATCQPRSMGDRLDYDIAIDGLCARASPPEETHF